jgi:hypothetical protein
VNKQHIKNNWLRELLILPGKLQGKLKELNSENNRILSTLLAG